MNTLGVLFIVAAFVQCGLAAMRSHGCLAVVNLISLTIGIALAIWVLVS